MKGANTKKRRKIKRIINQTIYSFIISALVLFFVLVSAERWKRFFCCLSVINLATFIMSLCADAATMLAFLLLYSFYYSKEVKRRDLYFIRENINIILKL